MSQDVRSDTMHTSDLGGGDEARLRILHVSEVHWGGVVTLLRHYAAEQHRAGHEVHLLAPPEMPPIPGAGHHPWPVRRSALTSVAQSVPSLRRTVESLQPDVVHLHSFVAGQLGRLPRHRRRREVVVYQPHAWSHGLFTSRAATLAVAEAERRAARRTDLLVANCQDEIDAGHALGVRLPARSLGVAVDLTTFRPPSEEERRQHREALGVAGQKVMLVLGRIAHQKGQDMLVRAWEQQHEPDQVLVLVGPGNTATLQALAPTQWGRSVRAVGEPDTVLPWLWAADILVMPSRYETVGLAVAEALATGLPVVATDFDGAEETICRDPLPSAGAVVPLDDMESLLQAACDRLSDDARRGEECAAARIRAEQLFRPEVVAGRLESAYRYALAAVRGGRT